MCKIESGNAKYVPSSSTNAKKIKSHFQLGAERQPYTVCSCKPCMLYKLPVAYKTLKNVPQLCFNLDCLHFTTTDNTSADYSQSLLQYVHLNELVARFQWWATNTNVLIMNQDQNKHPWYSESQCNRCTASSKTMPCTLKRHQRSPMNFRTDVVAVGAEAAN